MPDYAVRSATCPRPSLIEGGHLTIPALGAWHDNFATGTVHELEYSLGGLCEEDAVACAKDPAIRGQDPDDVCTERSLRTARHLRGSHKSAFPPGPLTAAVPTRGLPLFTETWTWPRWGTWATNVTEATTCVADYVPFRPGIMDSQAEPRCSFLKPACCSESALEGRQD